MDKDYRPPVDGRWQHKPGGISGAPGKAPRGKKNKVVRTPHGSGPFTNDEVARGYRFRPLATSVTNPQGMQNAGKNLDRLLHQ